MAQDDTSFIVQIGHANPLFLSLSNRGRCLNGLSGIEWGCCCLMHHQGIICGVAFARSSLRRIGSYASVVAPWRLASDAFLVIRNCLKLAYSVQSANYAVHLVPPFPVDFRMIRNTGINKKS